MQKFGWAYQRTGFNGTSNPGQSAVRRVLIGMGDYLPRGAKVFWQGRVQDTLFTLGNDGRLDQFRQALEAHGYAITDGPNWNVLNALDSIFAPSATIQITVSAVTPVDFSDAKDTFADITGIAAQIWGQMPTNIVTAVTNVPYVDNSGVSRYQAAPAIGTPPDARQTAPDACKDKSGLDWIACQLGFDKLASSWGLAAGAGATLALGAIIVTGLVILKK